MKKDREILFKKYNGRCAYCGCTLEKGWHIDEIEPVIRKQKYIKPYFSEERDKHGHKIYVPGKWVNDGVEFPERKTLANQNPACASCNINKHSLSLEDFRNLIAGFMKHLNEISTQYKVAKRYGLVNETNIQVKFYFETFNQLNNPNDNSKT